MRLSPVSRTLGAGIAGLALGLAALGACMAGEPNPETASSRQPMTGAELSLAVGDYAAAREAVVPLAEGGDAAAECALGDMYAYGRGVEVDREKARHWYERAAAHGCVVAEYRLGYHHFDDSSVEGRRRTFEAAAPWMKRAAGRGFAPAQHWMCWVGRQVRAEGQDGASVDLEWCERAATQGHTAAQYKLASMYAEGVGAQKDEVKALAWFRRAAEGGLGAALGDIDTLVGPDAAARINSEYEERARKGEPRSQALIGMMYSLGWWEGIRQDIGVGQTWSSRAAAQKNPKGAADIALSYATGRGAPRDYVQAYVWFSLAAAYSGDVDIDWRDQILGLRDQEVANLTPDQVEVARWLVTEKLREDGLASPATRRALRLDGFSLTPGISVEDLVRKWGPAGYEGPIREMLSFTLDGSLKLWVSPYPGDQKNVARLVLASNADSPAPGFSTVFNDLEITKTRSLSQLDFSARVEAGKVSSVWGPPDAVAGSGFDSWFYEMTDGGWAVLSYSSIPRYVVSARSVSADGITIKPLLPGIQ